MCVLSTALPIPHYLCLVSVSLYATGTKCCTIYSPVRFATSSYSARNPFPDTCTHTRNTHARCDVLYERFTRHRNSFESEMFNRASMKLGLEQAVLGDAAGSLKPRDMEDLLKKGAYALTQMDEVDAMRCVLFLYTRACTDICTLPKLFCVVMQGTGDMVYSISFCPRAETPIHQSSSLAYSLGMVEGRHNRFVILE